MSALSSVAISAAASVSSPSIADDGADRDLEFLGRQFDAAWAYENDCYRASDQLHKNERLERLREIPKYRKNKVDRAIKSFLGESAEHYCFYPCDIEDLRGCQLNNGAAVDRRVQQLIAAHDEKAALEIKLGCPEADKRAEQASAATRQIVSQIENSKATTLAGLMVKARAVVWCHAGELDFDDDDYATDSRLMQSIVHDLLGCGRS